MNRKINNLRLTITKETDSLNISLATKDKDLELTAAEEMASIATLSVQCLSKSFWEGVRGKKMSVQEKFEFLTEFAALVNKQLMNDLIETGNFSVKELKGEAIRLSKIVGAELDCEEDDEDEEDEEVSKEEAVKDIINRIKRENNLS